MKFLKETTKYDVDYKVPMHTYAFENNRCVGYIKEGDRKLILFKKPSAQFNKKGRTFVEVKNVSIL